MTDQEQSNQSSGAFTEEPKVVYSEDINGRQVATITHPKYTQPIYVHKDNTGYIFYKVSMKVGETPEALNGRYSSVHTGVKAVTDYLKTVKPTPASVLKLHREERNASKLRSVSN